MIRQRHTIDATGQTLGRLATQVAVLLRGKNKVTFEPNIDGGDFVTVTNAGKLKFTGKKFDQKIYYHHSGHVGGIKEAPLKYLMANKPEQVVRQAIHDMIPKNKLRARALKRLSITK
jgi:large subunit ribosomal protein L13